MAYRIIYNANGDIVRRSRNLRGMLENSIKRQTYVESVTLRRNGNGGTMSVTWGNGDYTRSDFADYGVMLTFLMYRNSWVGATITDHNGYRGEYSANLARDLFNEFMNQ